ncbi:MAG: DUF1553 domain-containing protein, partial [Verrucomicrobiota bacterium]
MRDFYALGAFFADVKEAIIGGREPGMLVPDAAQAPVLARLESVLKERQADYDAPHRELGEAFARWEQAQREAVASDARWIRLTPARAESTGGATLKVRDDQSVLASGPAPDRDTYRLTFTNVLESVVGLRLEVLPDDSLPAKGPGRAGNGNFVLSEVVARVERDGKPARPVSFKSARATHEQTTLAENNPYGRWSAASAIDDDAKGPGAGWAILPETGKPNQLLLATAAPTTLVPGETLVVELQQQHGNGRHTLGRLRLAFTRENRAVDSPAALPPPPDIAELLKPDSKLPAEERRAKLFQRFKELAPEFADRRQRLETARKEKTDFEAKVARCLVTERLDEPRTVRVLPRGNWMIETGEIISPALPAFLAPAPAGDRRLNRLDLARWLVSRDNPLTARVVMNRLWRQFFGIGLSKVLDDLGAQGEPPPNQPLLDWLACEFMDSGWDVRHIVRTIVLSSTYRQTSDATAEQIARDPYNREHARQSRFRVDAELVRDSALAVSGL